ncbi:hypothetical protein AArcSt2_15125 [Natronocalculus amylovorans]|uniref:Uncharacterized protein n=2 Tax=Natronocalculus amylovorans TaxID=2917812 RepID=A0AAE3FZK6_9EURY|nr:hypothetical protein [Natronocalculus amylovorans]MCL9818272.1 hypothetical protein [Natronocalculus amylovorans]
MYSQGGFLAAGSEPFPIYAATRPLYEQLLRRRVSKLDGVQLRGNCAFLNYLTDDGATRVNGVVIRDDGSVQELAADMVIDATGRTSRTPNWLQKHGYTPPEIEEVHVDLAYSAILIDRPVDDRRMIGVLAEAPRTRGGAVLPVEDDRWLVNLHGIHLYDFCVSVRTKCMNETPDDIEFLVTSDHRVAVLDTLAASSSDRDGLRAATGASSPTMSRILSDFEDRHWIEREGRTYQLTRLGEFVADRLEEFVDAMTIERRIREVWPWLPHEIEGFDLGPFTDVVVSRPGPGYPYQPVERFTHLLTDTTTMRGFGMVILKSSNLEPFFDHALDELECEYIYPPSIFEKLIAWDRDTVVGAVDRANYTVWLHDNLPLADQCGICLFDDRVSLCCYDHETGTLQTLVDTGSEDIRRWAESYYSQFQAEARPLGDVDSVVLDDSSP